jgi:hypothetical protein
MNREEWLTSLAERLRPAFERRHLTLPAYRVSCGFPSKSALGRKSRRIGECWGHEQSGDGTHEVFVSPLLAESLDVAQVLCHELIHAAVGCEHGHKAPFKRGMTAMGLEGKATATEGGPEFIMLVTPMLAELGDYPHAALSPTLNEHKQSTRLIKVSCEDCENEGEPYIVRMSRQTFYRAAPICPFHNVDMSAPEV